MTFQTGDGRTDSFMDGTEIELSDGMTKDDCSFVASSEQYKSLAIRNITNHFKENIESNYRHDFVIIIVHLGMSGNTVYKESDTYSVLWTRIRPLCECPAISLWPWQQKNLLEKHLQVHE